ncbi:serine/threonine protein phosphatase [Trichocoleus sp. DQ-A3]|uniref:metallophosphoesterase family protein n=1 Tax=Cyanophyceae TaxID=3028117 RepID=UPI0016825C7A|nr:metallophosphoesterase family protein [Coleofasciculus sp. FACHB-125]MBD1903423.1 serine/threonine protein phosphatase [Coleofasciculus sp. FACHB-125]
MRILAIGDIHGCSTAFEELIAAVDLQPEDRVVTLGDYVDHGPDSKGILNRLIALHNTEQLVALRGNHERMMLQAYKNSAWELPWLNCGGDKTLASYSVTGKAGKLADVPDNHWEFLKKVCVNWYETDTHLFVHANAHPEMPLAEQPEHILLWEPFEYVQRHCSGKTLVCGHTVQTSGIPRHIGYAVCIDTWVYGKGWLTCWDIISGRVWQANQSAEVRTAWINEFTSSVCQ